MATILTSLHGRLLGLTGSGKLMCPAGFVAGADGSQFGLMAPNHITLFDDFVGKTLGTPWGVVKGSDGGAANFAISAALNGRIVATTGAGAGATMAVNGVQIDAQLNFEADSGGCSMQARVQAAAITTFAIFVGFTNEVGTLQMPAVGTGGGNGVTYNAVDCVGVLYDTTMTTKDWWLVGQANSVPAAAQDSGLAPTAATDDIWRVDVDASGNATFYHGAGIAAGGGLIQGVRMAGAVTKSVPLSPVIAAFRRSAASTTVSVDYIYAGVPRV